MAAMTAGTEQPRGSEVTTWADGFGRWYAAVPGYRKHPRRVAREAIRRELAARGEIGAGSVVRVEDAPDYWLTTARAERPVYREAIVDQAR